MKRGYIQSKSHVKNGDQVTVIAGAEKGKSGKVLQVNRDSARAVVEGLNIVKKAIRKTQDNPQGGIIEKEASIAVSNLRVDESASSGK